VLKVLFLQFLQGGGHEVAAEAEHMTTSLAAYSSHCPLLIVWSSLREIACIVNRKEGMDKVGID